MKMGPLEQWENRVDLLTEICMAGLDGVTDIVLDQLSAADLRMCRMVSSSWLTIVQRSTIHREAGRLGKGWTSGEPALGVMQCTRERSVCTVTALAVDETGIAAALGSSGRIELWDRRSLERRLSFVAHLEGVYSVALGRSILVSGGEDSKVRIWCRESGEELLVLSHHTYIVWSVQLCGSQLVSASYDCTVVVSTLPSSLLQEMATSSSSNPLKCVTEEEVKQVSKVQGPWEWADALFLEESGERLVVQDETIFELTVWQIPTTTIISRLSGHTDEVHSVDLRGGLLVSGAADTTVRLWNAATGVCLAKLEGHKGKVWSVSLARERVASGGRHGEVRVWPLPEKAQILMEGRPEERRENDPTHDPEDKLKHEENEAKALISDLIEMNNSTDSKALWQKGNKQENGSEQETDIEVSQETDVEMSQETDIEVSQETDIELSQETDVEMAQETDIELSQDTEVEMSQETDIEVPQETEVEVSHETEVEVSREGRPLHHHPISTSVSAIHLDHFTLISGDGLATILQWDFWAAQGSTECSKYLEPVPDPVS